MSYEVTDAGEQDMIAELQVLDELIEQIDQEAATAKECGTVAPQLHRALAVAYWIAETARLETAGTLSCGHTGQEPRCMCCRYYREITSTARVIAGRL
jgi:hypothetical protein